MIEIVKNLEEAIAITDKEGNVTFFNSSFEKLFGKSEHIISIFKDDDKEIFFKNLINLTLKDNQYSNFIRFRSKDNNLIFCWLHTFRIEDKIVFEIFNLEKAKRRGINISDQQYIGVIKYMAEGIAHSIRNPIMSAGGMLHRIKAKLPEDLKKSVSGYIDVVEKSLYRILNIIANIEVVTSSLPTNLKKINLKRVIEKIVERYRENYKVNIRSSLEEIEIFADATHISFIVEELLKNAIEATEAKSDPMIAVELKKSGNDAIINVKDNGKGMSEEETELVTIPFYSTKPGNMGVGLSLSRFLVEGYGGHITIDSKKGKGTTVTVVLPIEKRNILRREVVDV